MSFHADTRVAAQARSGDGASPLRPTVSGASGRSRRRDYLVFTYLILALAALAPGVAFKFGIGFGTSLEGFSASLDDIRFGSGLRFWLGVIGASLMGLLLLYPVRKAFAKGRGAGTVGAWFHAHILFGIAGPVLVLYHTNFGFGGSNANVALVSMVVVAVSGLAGYFIYGRASHNFYATRDQAQQHRDAIVSLLSRIAPSSCEIAPLLATLGAFDADLLTPRLGLVARLRARYRVEAYRRSVWQKIVACAQDAVRTGAISSQDYPEAMSVLSGHARAYFQFGRTTAGRSVVEQLWAWWRLFHLPVFLIMVVATCLHVWAVWDMDGTGRAEAPSDIVVANSRADNRADSEQQVALPPRPMPTAPAAAPGVPPPKLIVAPVPISRPPQPKDVTKGAVASRTQTDDDTTISEFLGRPDGNETSERKIVTAPQPVARPIRAPAQTLPSAPSPPPPMAVADVPRPKPAMANAEIKEVYSELQNRKIAPPMALGGGLPKTLREQFAVFREKQAAGQFHHTGAETGFALTGKHLKVECASCHTAPLTGLRSDNPRACVDCHKKDDVHKGRRQECANCHTTNRWSQIIRRK